MLSKSDATLFDGDTVAELVTELVDMKRRSGAPDAETDLKIVLDFNSDGPSDINNQTLTKHRIQKLRQTLSPHLALAFLSKIGAKRAREADDRADRAIAARILQQDSPSTAAAIEAALRDASQGCTWRERQDMAAAFAKKIEGFAPFRALQCNMDLPPRQLDYDTPLHLEEPATLEECETRRPLPVHCIVNFEAPRERRTSHSAPPLTTRPRVNRCTRTTDKTSSRW